MLFSEKAKLGFLAMPKAGSTSIEQALRPHCDISYSNSPHFTHMTARLFNTHMRPYFKHRKIEGVETCCLMRHPVSWLGSWYRYFGMEQFNGKPQSTKDMSFDAFADLYISRDNEAIASIARPWDFVRGHNGKIAVNQIFRFENMDIFQKFLEERFQKSLEFERLNVSPERLTNLSPGVMKELEDYYSLEFDIYESIKD